MRILIRREDARDTNLTEVEPEFSTGNYQSLTRPPLIAVYGVVVF